MIILNYYIPGEMNNSFKEKSKKEKERKSRIGKRPLSEINIE